MYTFLRETIKQIKPGGFFKNPFFYFGAISCLLLGFLFLSSSSLAEANYVNNNNIVVFNSFFKNPSNLSDNNLFFSQNGETPLETPDLKIVDDNAIDAVSTPSILTTQTLGDIFGGSQNERTDVVGYTVVLGDTVQSVAAQFNISVNTLLWANGLTQNSTLQVGQSLVILPVSGVSYIVKSGDTLSQIAKTFQANEDDIIAFNNLANDEDIFIGDTLIIPGGIMPQKTVNSVGNVPLADDYFIYPAEGIITQGLHYYDAIDLANKCGTPVYAAAAGVVQRAVSNNGWNLGMGNYITILHPNGTVTYYGHEEAVFVKTGDKVDTGDRIGLMGETGDATGCHVHFEVIGAANPLAKYSVGTVIRYNQ